MAKSKKLHDLITEKEANFTRNGEEIHEESETVPTAVMQEERCCHVSFNDFPGGAKMFEMAGKFCYT